MALLDAYNRGPESVVGEDTWDLFATIEEAFSVDLGDYHKLIGVTVSELVEQIHEKAEYPASEKCLSSVSFYRLRRTLETQFQIQRSAVRIDTSVDRLFPWISRRRQWVTLQECLGLKVPALRYPGWLLYLALATSAVFALSLKALFGQRISLMGVIGISLISCLPIILAFTPFGRALPEGCQTIGGLTRVILSYNFGALASAYGSSPNENTLLSLRLIIATEIGLKIEQVAANTRIPGDLNIE